MRIAIYYEVHYASASGEGVYVDFTILSNAIAYADTLNRSYRLFKTHEEVDDTFENDRLVDPND